MTNEELLRNAIYNKNTKLFDSNTLSYFKQTAHVEQAQSDDFISGFQLVQFDWLSWPDAGFFGCPFKAGCFFTNKMTSGKLGVWLCVKECHDRNLEAGEILAYFVGYRFEQHFYNEKDISFLIQNYKRYRFVFDTARYIHHTEL